MFNLSGHNRGDSDNSAVQASKAGGTSESFSQSITDSLPVLTGMSREMRSQMNAVVAFSFMLSRNDYSEKEREEFSSHIYNSCEQIITMFDNFLDFAIINTGNLRSESVVFNPEELFGDLFSEFRELLKQEKYKDVILVSGSQVFQNSEFIIDTNKLSRVIRNLFHNALNFTKSGVINASYSICNKRIEFSIADSGPSYLKCREFIQSNHLSQSLSKFNDISIAVSFALTRKLVRMLDGSIWIERNGKTGSMIRISVPVSASVNSDDSLNRLTNTMSAI